MFSVDFNNLYLNFLNSLLGSFGLASLNEIEPLSRSTLQTSNGISTWYSCKTYVSIPIKKGTGASRTSIMLLGRIGTRTCFQHKGNKKEIKATAACVSKALCLDISKTFFSNNKAMKMSITCSASNALNKNSMSYF